jgi:DNA modification methylase
MEKDKQNTIKPYFETESGILYHGKCEDILPCMPPYDLLLTDPPYGVDIGNQSQGKGGGVAKKNDYGENNWDSKPPSDIEFELMKMKSKNQIIFGGNYFVEHLSNSSCWIVWDKKNGNSDFADCELAWTSFDSAVRKIDYRWAGMLQEYGGKAKEKRYHPTQKPVGLFTRILEMYSEKGQTILDCYGGSGTTALACIKMDRKWVLIEQEEKYCEIIKYRIEKALEQKELFPGFGIK